MLWLRSWMNRVKAIGHIAVADVFKDDTTHGDDILPYSVIYSQMDLVLSLDLKSMALRYDHLRKSVEMLAIGLMGQPTAQLTKSGYAFTLAGALDKCDLILDFFIGLFGGGRRKFIIFFTLSIRRRRSGTWCFSDVAIAVGDHRAWRRSFS